jgi:hypothetical protein
VNQPTYSTPSGVYSTTTGAVDYSSPGGIPYSPTTTYSSTTGGIAYSTTTGGVYTTTTGGYPQLAGGCDWVSAYNTPDGVTPVDAAKQAACSASGGMYTAYAIGKNPLNSYTAGFECCGGTFSANTFGRRRRLLEAHSPTLNTVAGSDGSNALILSAGAMVVVALFASSVLIVRRAVDAGFKREVELLEVELLEAGSE